LLFVKDTLRIPQQALEIDRLLDVVLTTLYDLTPQHLQHDVQLDFGIQHRHLVTQTCVPEA